MLYKNDDKIGRAVAKTKEIPIISIPGFVLEGGSVELDGVTDEDITMFDEIHTGLDAAARQAFYSLLLKDSWSGCFQVILMWALFGFTVNRFHKAYDKSV